MLPSPCTTAINHDTGLCRSTPSDEQQRAIESGELVLLCQHCVHPPPAGGGLRGIPQVGPYHAVQGESGQFCSLNCMVAWTLERPTYRRPIQRAEILKLASVEYELDEILPAPPQDLLAVFGGHLTIEEFRSHTGAQHLLRRCTPPFVSSLSISAITEIYQTKPPAPGQDPVLVVPVPSMNVEDCGSRQLTQLDEWGLTGLRQPLTQPDDLLEPSAPPKESFYERFINGCGEPGASAEEATPPPRQPDPKRRASRARPSVGGATGGLSRFLKPA
jgi:hypothetical protein